MLMGLAVLTVLASCSAVSDDRAATVLTEQRADVTVAARELGDLVSGSGGAAHFSGAPVQCGGSPSYGAKFSAGATWAGSVDDRNKRIAALAQGVRDRGWMVTESGTDDSGIDYWLFARGGLRLNVAKGARRGSGDVDLGLGASECVRVSKEYANSKIPAEARPLD